MKEFERINGLASKAIANEQERLTADIQMCNGRLNNFQRALTLQTTEFVRTGIGRPGKDPKGDYLWTWWLHWGQRSYFNWRTYFRQLAKDTHRPFVYLKDDDSLEIERKKYTDPLIAGFLLVAEKRDDGRSLYAENRVTYSSCQSLWRFRFSGDTKEQLSDWVKLCATDHRMRKALRLDT